MKLVRHKAAGGGEWWVVSHQLSISDGRLQNLRPVHLFTFLATHLVEGNTQRLFGLCFALENKLYAARHHLRELRRALGSVDDPVYVKGYVREYESHQAFVAALEAMLSAVYAALEIAAQINRSLHADLPNGFRRQAKRHQLFSFESNPWVPRFLDIRSELGHFGTVLPVVSKGAVIMEFTTPKRLEVFERGRQEIQLGELFSFPSMLFDLLDRWASSELGRIPHDTEVDSFRQVSVNAPLEHQRITVGELLGLLASGEAV